MSEQAHTDWDEPRDVKGLAAVLKRSREYVADMRSSGFIMPGGRATLRMAFDWLAKHPDFTRHAARRARFARRAQMVTPGNTARLAE
jgi:hypothetical protein